MFPWSAPGAAPDDLPRYPAIPYGRANFRRIRLDRCLYVDKSRFIRLLEHERFAFFIRPRRFGKTLWLTMLETYRRLGIFDQEPDAALDTMCEWYDGYRFAKGAASTVYNTDMVLYYLQHSVPNRPGPDNLIDANVRIDYGKLRHLLVTGRQLNGNFDLLREVIAEGRADSEIVDSFPLARLDERENFLSLMHCFGLLSIRGMAAGVPRLAIPNQTVRRLMYGYLRDAYQDVGVFSVDLVAFDRLTRRMALTGHWRPAFERLGAAVADQTGIRWSWRRATPTWCWSRARRAIRACGTAS